MSTHRIRRSKKKTPFKFIVRRFMLVLLIVLLVFVGGMFAASKLLPPVDGQQDEESGQEEDGDADDAQSSPPAAPISADLDDWRLLLVNYANAIPTGYEDAIETEVVYRDGEREYHVDARVAPALLQMVTDAKASGVNLLICSAYRSHAYQQELYQGRLQEQLDAGKSQEEAAMAVLQYTNYPGTSEHQTGLAVDIVTPDYQNLDEGFAETPAFRWLSEKAHEYGFILRYPKEKEEYTKVEYEPWHYRYVGVEHATAIREQGLCLEEYINLIKYPDGAVPVDEINVADEAQETLRTEPQQSQAPAAAQQQSSTRSDEGVAADGEEPSDSTDREDETGADDGNGDDSGNDEMELPDKPKDTQSSSSSKAERSSSSAPEVSQPKDDEPVTPSGTVIFNPTE